MNGWQWAVLAAELVVLLFAFDWARRDFKYGRRMREWRRRVERRSGDAWRDLPPHERADFLAALVCARDNGDLLTSREDATAEILRFPKPRP